MSQKLLLDIDCDFLLNRDVNDGCWGNKPRTYARMTGKTLAKRLKRFMKPETKVFFVVDHQESLFYWDLLKIKNADCIHIDAHHDCWSDCVEEKNDRLKVHCGSYLAQAITDGVVKKLTYVPALFRYTLEESMELLGEFEWISIDHRNIRTLNWKKFLTEMASNRHLKADVITICVSPEWFPRKFWTHALQLCKAFEVQKEQIKEVWKRANIKWAEEKKNKWHPPGEPIRNLDFIFPYIDRRKAPKRPNLNHRTTKKS